MLDIVWTSQYLLVTFHIFLSNYFFCLLPLVLPLHEYQKVFDLLEFKSQLAKEKAKGEEHMDHRKLAKLSVVSISFVKDTIKDTDTPCWILVVILPALRLESLRPKGN